MLKPTKVLALLATVSMVALAGCSSTETKNDYVDTVNDIQSNVIAAANSLASNSSTDKKTILGAFDDADAQVKDAIDQLNTIDVPSEAEAGHADLVAGFEDLEKLIVDVKEQVEKGGGLEAFQELQSKGTDIDTRIGEAIDKINEDLGAT